MTGEARIIRGNALDLPLDDESVDLVVTSPPYFALRSYRDGGEHYDGQIGAESTPDQFIDALLAATREMKRVLKPSGSIFVNLGDKYSGAQAQTTKARSTDDSSDTWRRTDPKRIGVPGKSLIGVPWRYAIRCIDELGLILRAEIIWAKPNGLPESVTDRVRRSHEQWFHFTKAPRYFSAIDEIREAYTAPPFRGQKKHKAGDTAQTANPVLASVTSWDASTYEGNPLGKLPGSVWTIATEPLKVDPALGIDHFAAFPTEWPRRIILGWSPSAICTVCDEGLRPVVDKERVGAKEITTAIGRMDGMRNDEAIHAGRISEALATITGYACACDEPIASPTGKRTGDDPSLETGRGGFNRPRGECEGTTITTRWQHSHWAAELKSSPHRSRIERLAARLHGPHAFAHWVRTDVSGARPIPVAFRTALLQRGWLTDAPEMGERGLRPAVVLDPFSGTGTTAGVAKALGRIGIGVDMSADYCRLAEWRTNGAGYDVIERKVHERTYGKRARKQAPKPAESDDPNLFGDAA